MKPNRKKLIRSVCLLLIAMSSVSSIQAEETAPDLMSFAHGTLPVSIDTGSATLRIESEHAIAVIDGNPSGFVAMHKPATPSDTVEIIYELSAATRFDRFAVPNIRETPSPSQTFFKSIEVWGSAEGVEGQFQPLASAELTTHDGPGEVTELTMVDEQPEVRWVKLRLRDGINVERENSFFEFSELIGNGVQQSSEPSNLFNGVWRGRGVKLELLQESASVTGCYDSNSTLSGSVDGRVLRALGTNSAGIGSQFILIATEDGAIQGLRSTNGAPFKPYIGDTSDKSPVCLPPVPAKLGCGSIVHGIGFDFDSAEIRPASHPIISSLYEGLSDETASSMKIIGHSSSEGAADYNRRLSQQRAESVVAALVELGLDPVRLSASGRGEIEPIASNDDEAGRSMNRRVEISCSD